MNPLQQIPANVRRWLYLAYALLIVADGAAVAGYGAAGQPIPTELVVAGAVLLYVGAPFGFTAASNITEPTTVQVTAPAEVTVDVEQHVNSASAEEA